MSKLISDFFSKLETHSFEFTFQFNKRSFSISLEDNQPRIVIESGSLNLSAAPKQILDSSLNTTLVQQTSLYVLQLVVIWLIHSVLSAFVLLWLCDNASQLLLIGCVMLGLIARL